MKEVRVEHDYRLAEQERMIKENEALANSKLIKEKDGSYYEYSRDSSRDYSRNKEYYDENYEGYSRDGKHYEDDSINSSIRNPYSPNNEDNRSLSGNFTFSPRKKGNLRGFAGDSERTSGEFYGASDGVSSGKGGAKSPGGDAKASKGTKSPTEIKHMIMSDREVMLFNVREKLNAYVGKSGSKYSVINAAKRNIDTRNEYIDYMYKEGLSGADILEGDNKKDEQLLQDLNKNGRTYFLEYMY